MRFLGALFLGVCHARAADKPNAEPVTTPASPEAVQPQETKASVDARLALVAICPEATSNCSVPTGLVAQNEDLANALDCMLKINITTIAPGPCHDALERFLGDHLDPLNRLMQRQMPFPMGPQFPVPPQMRPQFPMSPTMLMMRPDQPQAMPPALMELMQRIAAASPQPPMMMPFGQYPRFPPSNPRGRESRNSFPHHGFPSRPPMSWMSRYHDHSRSRWHDEDDSRWGPSPYSKMYHSHRRGEDSRSKHNRWHEDDNRWGSSRHSSKYQSKKSHSKSHSKSHHSEKSLRLYKSYSKPHSSYSNMRGRSPPSRNMPSRSSSSPMMNPVMMMILPQLMARGSSSQNPMSGLLMATLMKKMASSGDSDYDYDYGYDYGYDYDNDDFASDYEYDYDYDYEEDDSSSPLASIIQQLIRQKLAARKPVVEVSLDSKMMEPPQETEISNSEEPIANVPKSVEIAQPSTRTAKDNRPNEQVSYRNAP